MSSTAGGPPLVRISAPSVTGIRLQLGPVTLPLYEHLIPSPCSGNATCATALFLGTRYLALLAVTVLTGVTAATREHVFSGVAISRGVAADLIVAVLTWRCTLRGGGIRGISRATSSLARVLFLNGTIYFLLIGTMNLLQLILTIVSVVYEADSTSQVVLFVDPLAAILICRFLLSLQSANLKALDVRPGDETILSTDRGCGTGDSLRFASGIVHSVGGGP
ncbi:hypothetical protein BV20DRAFT_1057132 [Pilatotrama ljubarskyi]|nr:hypothetical protein BV20DRAFT_1057132 [Pilatotrama ljubarskyi]